MNNRFVQPLITTIVSILAALGISAIVYSHIETSRKSGLQNFVVQQPTPPEQPPNSQLQVIGRYSEIARGECLVFRIEDRSWTGYFVKCGNYPPVELKGSRMKEDLGSYSIEELKVLRAGKLHLLPKLYGWLYTRILEAEIILTDEELTRRYNWIDESK